MTSKKELVLIETAQCSTSETLANEAMRVLRSHYDPTYKWCEDCDGLVCKEKDCCLNQVPTKKGIEL